MPDPGGPYLTMLVVCERVLQEADGVPSIIRIIDRLNVIRAPGTGSSEPPPPPPPAVVVLGLSFKAGKARGSRELVIRLMAPSGLYQSELHQTLNFEGDDDRGISFFPTVLVDASTPGLYWFEVSLDQEWYGKTPLRIVRQQGSVVTPPQL